MGVFNYVVPTCVGVNPFVWLLYMLIECGPHVCGGEPGSTGRKYASD